jgi:release factor glutamine methyltransferase
VSRLRAAGCVFAEDEARLLLGAATSESHLDAMVRKRVAGLPLEHILGWVEFCGLRIAIEADVFVPRQRTEFLVREAARLAVPGAVVLDLCCGAGALGVALTSLVDVSELYATDLESAAVRCARRNVGAVGGEVFEGDLFEPLPPTLLGRVDILLANVPYVPTEAIALMPPEARDFEPRVTLDGGPDGLEVLRRVAAAASPWLAPGGHLLVEMSEEQAPLAADVLAAGHLLPRIATSDLFYSTVVIGTRAAPVLA